MKEDDFVDNEKKMYQQNKKIEKNHISENKKRFNTSEISEKKNISPVPK